MYTWESFVREYVQNWRTSFEGLGQKEKKVITEGHSVFSFSLPLQIEVITFENSSVCLWIVTHDYHRTDLLFTFQLEIKGAPSAFFKLQGETDPEWHKRFKETLLYVESWFETNISDQFSISEQGYLFIAYNKGLLEIDPKEKAHKDVRILLLETLILEERKKLGKNTEEILFEAEKVQDDTQRNKLLTAAKEIEASLDRLKSYEDHDKKIAGMAEEINGVRKLIGASMDYQDWRLLVEDVERLKKSSFVSSDLFVSELRRIYQRIDDLKEIKFWSKRTFLEISLAAVATISTIVAALLGAGIIHF